MSGSVVSVDVNVTVMLCHIAVETHHSNSITLSATGVGRRGRGVLVGRKTSVITNVLGRRLPGNNTFANFRGNFETV